MAEPVAEPVVAAVETLSEQTQQRVVKQVSAPVEPLTVCTVRGMRAAATGCAFAATGVEHDPQRRLIGHGQLGSLRTASAPSGAGGALPALAAGGEPHFRVYDTVWGWCRVLSQSHATHACPPNTTLRTVRRQRRPSRARSSRLGGGLTHTAADADGGGTQVEFYFSESNLPRDRFLRAEVAKTPNGAVGLALVCSFSRMRALLDIASATSDVPDATVAAVAACLQAGAPSLMLEQPGGACHERRLPRRRDVRLAGLPDDVVRRHPRVLCPATYSQPFRTREELMQCRGRRPGGGCVRFVHALNPPRESWRAACGGYRVRQCSGRRFLQYRDERERRWYLRYLEWTGKQVVSGQCDGRRHWRTGPRRRRRRMHAHCSRARLRLTPTWTTSRRSSLNTAPSTRYAPPSSNPSLYLPTLTSLRIMRRAGTLCTLCTLNAAYGESDGGESGSGGGGGAGATAAACGVEGLQGELLCGDG